MSRRSGRAAARWVAERVGQIAPPGLGHWPGAWELVEGPANEFLDALARWEDSGTDEDMEAARRAGGGVVAAWRAAAGRWEAAGRPTVDGAVLDRTPAGVGR
jgi:hypothetical protein